MLLANCYLLPGEYQLQRKHWTWNTAYTCYVSGSQENLSDCLTSGRASVEVLQLYRQQLLGKFDDVGLMSLFINGSYLKRIVPAEKNTVVKTTK